MRTFLFFIILVFATSSSVFAEDIDVKMQKIREASPKERVHLMNALKREIAVMNQTQRNEAINALRFKIKAKNDTSQGVKTGQFQNLQQSMQNQNANQKQVGSQYMKGQDTNKMKHQR